MMRFTRLVALYVGFSSLGMSSVWAQFSTSDMTVFDFSKYIELVGKENPGVVQLKSVFDQADARVLSASGAFDPKLYSTYSQKQFDSKTYYQKWETGIEYKTPTPFTFNAGFQENDGQFLNPENNSGKNRLWNLGVSMDLGRGLFTDEERTKFAVSKAERSQIREEVALSLNEFYLQSGETYWKWVQSYHVWQLYEGMLVLAQDLKQAMVTGFINGDRSAADTLEAHTIMRQRIVQRAEALIKYNEARLKLEAYLGQQIPKEYVPETINPNQVLPAWADTTQIQSFVQSHPMRRQYENKIAAAESELKLKREQLRPELQLYYNYLSDKDNLQFALEDQAQLGVKFKLPLLLRKERGGFREYKAKVRENESALEWAELKIEAQLTQELTAIQLFFDLFTQSFSFAAEMKQLLAYERRMFEIGESSLFKINQREYYYAIAEVESIKAYAAYHAQLIRWKVANGTAYLEWDAL